jgi:hypothetical protein
MKKIDDMEVVFRLQQDKQNLLESQQALALPGGRQHDSQQQVICVNKDHCDTKFRFASPSLSLLGAANRATGQF